MVVELLRLSSTAMGIPTALFMDLFRLCNTDMHRLLIVRWLFMLPKGSLYGRVRSQWSRRWCSWHYCPSCVVHCLESSGFLNHCWQQIRFGVLGIKLFAFALLRHAPVLEYFLDSLPLGTGRLHLQQRYCRMHSLQRLALRDVAFWKSLKPFAAFLKAHTWQHCGLWLCIIDSSGSFHSRSFHRSSIVLNRPCSWHCG